MTASGNPASSHDSRRLSGVHEGAAAPILEALPDHIAVLDPTGTIVAVNRAWRRFAAANGWHDPTCGVGTSYFAVCERAKDSHASDAARAIRDVLTGQTRERTVRYPCLTGEGPGPWFEMHVARPAGGGGAIVTHRPAGCLGDVEERLAEALAELGRLKERLEAENQLSHELSRAEEFEDLVGESAAMRRMFQRVERVARTDVTVMLLGETGTGKELVARAIHARSARRGRALVRVDCAALPATLIESELFGHEKGAFTGALERKLGRFELANGGSIFLDEIGDLAPEVQAKLLRVLQEGEFERVGSTSALRTDVRVIAATNRDLRGAIESGSFRPDLYYRLMVFPIELPPLRQRREDIPFLVSYFVTKHQRRMGRAIARVPTSLLDAFGAYPWPGNVRELENLVERALVVSTDGVLRIEDPLPDGFRDVWHSPSERLDDVERDHIRRVLARCGGRVKGPGNAACRLGLKPSTLRSRMKKLGIVRSEAVS